MAAKLGALLVGAQHDRRRVPAYGGVDAPLDVDLPGMPGLVADGDRVDVGGAGGKRQTRA